MKDIDARFGVVSRKLRAEKLVYSVQQLCGLLRSLFPGDSAKPHVDFVPWIHDFKSWAEERTNPTWAKHQGVSKYHHYRFTRVRVEGRESTRMHCKEWDLPDLEFFPPPLLPKPTQHNPDNVVPCHGIRVLLEDDHGTFDDVQVCKMNNKTVKDDLSAILAMVRKLSFQAPELWGVPPGQGVDQGQAVLDWKDLLEQLPFDENMEAAHQKPFTLPAGGAMYADMLREAQGASEETRINGVSLSAMAKELNMPHTRFMNFDDGRDEAKELHKKQTQVRDRRKREADKLLQDRGGTKTTVGRERCRIAGSARGLGSKGDETGQNTHGSRQDDQETTEEDEMQLDRDEGGQLCEKRGAKRKSDIDGTERTRSSTSGKKKRAKEGSVDKGEGGESKDGDERDESEDEDESYETEDEDGSDDEGKWNALSIRGAGTRKGRRWLIRWEQQPGDERDGYEETYSSSEQVKNWESISTARADLKWDERMVGRSIVGYFKCSDCNGKYSDSVSTETGVVKKYDRLIQRHTVEWQGDLRFYRMKQDGEIVPVKKDGSAKGEESEPSDEGDEENEMETIKHDLLNPGKAMYLFDSDTDKWKSTPSTLVQWYQKDSQQ